ncbi:MAG TPA: Gfo/Idh/MocA family oxidoreductase [Clostridiales bacterium]|mgnify:FL=1|nr:Gfo/Idh/MocA family oxidoreductase [Clostridiales bacterium]
MRYATIGTSWITESYIDGANSVPDTDLYAVYSRDEEKAKAFAEKHGAKKYFSSLEEMASCKEIEGVYIASPNSLHYEQSRMMLNAGKHVICEKPIAINPVEVEELISLADKKGLVYMEAIMMLHSPALKLLKQAIGEIGKVTTAHIDFCQLSSKYPAYLRGETPNIFNPDLGTGCLMDIGVYNVYFALELFGIPEKIYATGKFMRTGADACGSAIFEYPDKLVTLNYSKVSQSRTPSYINGDEGSVEVGSISQLTDIYKVNKAGEKTLTFGDSTRHTLMENEARNFYNFITEPEKHKDEYEHAKQIALNVSKVMKEIRNQVKGFKF